MKYIMSYVKIVYQPVHFFSSHFKKGLIDEQVRWTAMVIALIIVILYGLEGGIAPSLDNWTYLQSSLDIISFSLGFVLVFFFRSYFMRMVLEKGAGHTITALQSIFIIVAAWLPLVIMYVVGLFNSLFLDIDKAYLYYFFNAWNFLLMIIGFRTLTGIGWFRITVLVFVMLGMEYMGRYFFLGAGVR